MMHLSRLSEELILWMSPRVGFIDIADRFCTGSSIMPQKKTRRARNWCAARAAASPAMMALLMLMKSQPLAYKQRQPGRQRTAVRHGGHPDRHLRIYADMMRGVTVRPKPCARRRDCRVLPPPPTRADYR